MLLQVLLPLLLVSAMSAMPMDDVDEDVVERSPRESLPAPVTDLQKEEAVLLAGTLLKELSKEVKKEQNVKSREADDNLLEEEDFFNEPPQDEFERSPEEEEKIEQAVDEIEERSLEEVEDEEERETKENLTAEEKEKAKAKERRRKLIRKILKTFVKVKTFKNKHGKKVTVFSGKGGYERALKHFRLLKPKNVKGNKDHYTGYIGKTGKTYISLRKSSRSSKRPTLTVVTRKRVFKVRY